MDLGDRFLELVRLVDGLEGYWAETSLIIGSNRPYFCMSVEEPLANVARRFAQLVGSSVQRFAGKGGAIFTFRAPENLTAEGLGRAFQQYRVDRYGL